MAKLSIIISVLSSIAIGIAIALPPIYETKITKLHFFVQVTISGPNQSIFKVAETDITSSSPTLFGQVLVVDDPITVGPQPESTMLGRAQGSASFADLHDLGPHVSVTFVFTSGEYKGSTLIMLGRNDASHKYRQIPIVGGTGAFQLAQGIASSTNYSYDPLNNHQVFEYNIAVIHPEKNVFVD